MHKKFKETQSWSETMKVTQKNKRQRKGKQKKQKREECHKMVNK